MEEKKWKEGVSADTSGTLRDGVMEIEDVLDSGIDIRLECKSLVRKAARNDKDSGGLKTGYKPEDDGDTETPGESDNGTGTASDASDAGSVGTSFAGDWEGMTFIWNASYGWYADKDYLSDTKVHVLVTFKEVSGQLTYYANSTVGITPQDVR